MKYGIWDSQGRGGFLAADRNGPSTYDDLNLAKIACMAFQKQLGRSNGIFVKRITKKDLKRFNFRVDLGKPRMSGAEAIRQLEEGL